MMGWRDAKKEKRQWLETYMTGGRKRRSDNRKEKGEKCKRRNNGGRETKMRKQSWGSEKEKRMERKKSGTEG